MPVSSNIAVDGANEFSGAYGDYLSVGANSHWQAWQSAPYIVSGASVALCDFSQFSSYLVELIAATSTHDHHGERRSWPTGADHDAAAGRRSGHGDVGGPDAAVGRGGGGFTHRDCGSG